MTYCSLYVSICYDILTKSKEKEIKTMALKELREQKGYTVTQIARALGVGASAVCMWESGARQIKLANLTKLAKFYKMPILKLFKLVYMQEEKTAGK